MKIIYQGLIALVAASFAFSGCTEDQLTARPSGESVTTDQNEEVTEMIPERMIGLINGMYAYMNQLDVTGSGNHTEFGYPSTVISMELWGQDMVQTGNGYNWFWGDQIYSNRSYTSTDMYYHWRLLHGLIDKAHEVLRAVPTDTDNEDLIAYMGQARAMRAFCYLHLVQLYAHAYAGHENDPAVPILTEKTTREEAGNNPRATVEKVYEFILEDLTAAIGDLAGYRRGGKYEIDRQVAYGLLARAYLNMERWEDAAEAAHAARTGYTPMSPNEYVDMTTGFNDISNRAWMWGCDLNEINEVVATGIVNYPSHLGTLSYGYAWAGRMYKAISKDLYDATPDDDIRKACFLTDDGIFYLDGKPFMGAAPYANIKFKPYKGEILGDLNAGDWPLMRVEEMYLIEAEGLALGGDPSGAKALLEEFVQGYRDPNYTCAASSPTDLQEEIWMQRRIELWGEGFSWFDLKRLKKGTVRNYDGTNFLKTARYNLPAEHGLFLLRIPLKEIQSNHGITEADNNPIATPPALGQ